MIYTKIKMPRQLPQSVILLNELNEKVFKDTKIERKYQLGVSIYLKVLIQMAKSQLSTNPKINDVYDKSWELYKAEVEIHGKNKIIDIIKHYYNTKLSTQRDLELLEAQPKN